MKILSLDLATKTGWALRIGRDHVQSGVQEFVLKRGESPGMLFLRFRSWLKEINQLADGINLIVFEQAHHRGGAATQLCVGLVTDVLAFAAEIKAETMPVHTGTLKKFATGKGNAGKEEMIAAAKKRGYDPSDDNEADACLLLEYACAELYPFSCQNKAIE